jgi:anaerobic selenocysteine-containing dehydrogenase
MKGPERCTLLMSKGDADERGLRAGASVEVRTRVGAVTVPLEITDAMMPGVVSLPHGFGHQKAGVKMGIASARPGASLNDITDDARLDRLSGNAAFSGTPVTVRAALDGAE